MFVIKNSFIKSLFLAIVLFVCLYSIVSYFFLQNPDNPSQAQIELMNDKVYVANGARAQSAINEFIFSEYGEVDLFFPAVPFKAENFPALEVDIRNLTSNFQVELVWKIQGNPSVFQMPLIQPENNSKLNLISRNPNWQGLIEQIGLRIHPYADLGIKESSENEIFIQSLLLRKTSFVSDYLALFDYWVQFDPPTQGSINHVATKDELQFYSKPLIFIVIFTIIYALTLVLLKTQTRVLLFSMILSWLAIDLVFLLKSFKNSLWLSQTYAYEINQKLPDQDLKTIATQVQILLGYKDEANMEFVREKKVYILNDNRYELFRLIYHLIPVNANYLGLSDEESFESVKAGDYFLVIYPQYSSFKTMGGKLSVYNRSFKVNEVGKSSYFSLMEVVK